MHATRIAGFTSLPERVRAFIALRLDATVERQIAALIDRLRTPESGDQKSTIRWVRAANFHLTLFFLGPAVPRERLLPIAQALGAIAEVTAPFVIAARGVGAFPNLARPRIIWIGLEGEELSSLAARVTNAAARCGFMPESRAYTPHLTIGRVRAPRPPQRLGESLGDAADLSFGFSRIERVVLYRSEPGPRSSTYHELAAFPLGRRARTADGRAIE